MLRHPYDTPTFKTNALHLVSNEGRLKRLLQLRILTANIALPQSSLVITGGTFRHFRLV